jgi:hypothetical protein
MQYAKVVHAQIFPSPYRIQGTERVHSNELIGSATQRPVVHQDIVIVFCFNVVPLCKFE